MRCDSGSIDGKENLLAVEVLDLENVLLADLYAAVTYLQL